MGNGTRRAVVPPVEGATTGEVSPDAVAEDAGFREGSLEGVDRRQARRWRTLWHWTGIFIVVAGLLGASWILIVWFLISFVGWTPGFIGAEERTNAEHWGPLLLEYGGTMVFSVILWEGFRARRRGR